MAKKGVQHNAPPKRMQIPADFKALGAQGNVLVSAMFKGNK